MQPCVERSSYMPPSPGMTADLFVREERRDDTRTPTERISDPRVGSQFEWKAKADDQGTQTTWGRITWNRWCKCPDGDPC